MKTHRLLVLALMTMSMGIVFTAHASYLTLPIDGIAADVVASTTSWFDHDIISNQTTRYTGTIYSGASASLANCSNYYNGFGCYDGHNGIDYATSSGANIVAAADGTVEDIWWNNCGGWAMHVWHEDAGLSTLYAHHATTTIAGVNDNVLRGEHIAEVDSTGSCSTGAHLHFGVTNGYATSTSKRIDPYGWASTTITDPWSHNQGYLWTTDVPSFALISTTTGTISSDTTWRGNILVDGTVTINSGVTLTIDGAIVKFKDSTSKIVVNGTLDANGTPGATSSLVYFTSNKDDVGADTNYDGSATSPAAGDWRSIEVNSGGTATLDHAIIRYGGNSSGSQANIYNNGGVLVMTDATSTDAANYALLMTAGTTTCTRCEMSYSWNTVYYSNGTLTITDSYIHDNGYFGILAGGPGILTVTDTTFANHDLFGAGLVTYRQGLTFVHSGNTSLNTGGTYASNYHGFFTLGNVLGDVTWYADGLPYIVYPYPYSETALGTRVPHGSSLTIEPGVIVKFASSTGYLSASGTVQAIGTSNDPIYFTSIKDDTVGGDTNDDGAATTPGKGNWLGLVFGPYGAGATGTLAYTVTRYAGGSDPWTGAYPAVGNRSSVLSIASSTIADSAYTGVVHWTTDGSTTVTTSNIQNIDSWGMYSFESGTSSAEQNYWNHSTGPWPSGSGEPVGGTVDYTPFSTSLITW